jgi:hypothetical protein
MTKYLAIAFLITGFLMGDAYGEDEVYYCAETAVNGFEFDKNLQKYKPQLYNEHKFKIKFDRAAKKIEIKGHESNTVNGTYPCTVPFPSSPEWLSCPKNLSHFNFNSDNGRFVVGKMFGYISGDGDSIAVAYGKCDKF